MLPRDAFDLLRPCPARDRTGRRRVADSLPAALPGERLNSDVVGHLRSGVAAGMVILDAADPEVRTIRETAEDRPPPSMRAVLHRRTSKVAVGTTQVVPYGHSPVSPCRGSDHRSGVAAAGVSCGL